ncbi:MAG: DNA-directed RNA polymerase subunit beta' [Chloroflexi bacterium]|nr:DNA-directed RNA polymerase subunit beta' [Chloroflexota bacterium]
MLEVNDFSAVRISLASPEQIRSWSYGEVTKPETINYRTLKPEKDGLFCERIFGPTKDFECYCGKYKRVRYRGIICDKCGVEVARAKVRRERMGHIELAAPVSHIWFMKGTPSRLGLLLDMSPRSLERVLYFAQFIVTSVDEEARQQAITETNEELQRLLEPKEAAASERLAAVQAGLEQRLKELQEELAQATSADSDEAKALRQAAVALQDELGGRRGKKATKDVVFEDHQVVAKGEVIKRASVQAIQRILDERLAELAGPAGAEMQGQRDLLQAQIEQAQREAQEQAAAIQQELEQQRQEVRDQFAERLQDLKDLRPQLLLTEAKYRALRERFPLSFKAGMGAEAVLESLRNLDLESLRNQLYQEIQASSGQRRKKATKRLRVVEALRKSGNKPEWMILTVLPVLPPELRPMVQLDGGRFATSDLNDLYRRVINRNNRLRRLLELGAPDIIIRNEKRMLQEAVDSLIDNGRRGRAVAGTSNHKLKSLSDMLRGKQGRFRQNLLGKRVDYSGRSVIVVGPELKLGQCGLPKRMALELFKPFVMQRLVARGFAHNIKSAKRIAERVRPEVWDVLEEVIKDRPVLLNRAPTLHRLGIQAFEPVLIEGSAIQIHPLVCTAFNADFDGDQMAVHVPLSRWAVKEARQIMLSTYNMLSPSSGDPIVAPTLDMVLGCYYLTVIRPGARGEGSAFGSFAEARLVHELGHVHLQAKIKVKEPARGVPELIETSVGRIIFNETLPPQMPFRNETMDKKLLKEVAAQVYQVAGSEQAAAILDSIKALGFRYSTRSGVTIAMHDIEAPSNKAAIIAEADRHIAEIEQQYQRGLITDEERYNSAVEIWTHTTDEISNSISQSLHRYGSVYMMATSGAKGNIAQIRQMAGMRGLMSDPSGRIIDLPIRSSFKEGLTVLEYFISTHGARKGLADTALRTADSGYLTRRLVDVSQDVVVLEEECGTPDGTWVREPPEGALLGSFAEKLLGRMAARPLAHPETGEVLVERNQELDEEKIRKLQEARIKEVYVRSALTCQARRGVCRLCYGRSLARGKLVSMREAVGIIAAQSIGEPGTQLTMRTFHTGGIAGVDITSGLPRIEELFEARTPRGQAIISEIDGVVQIEREEGGSRLLRVVSSEVYRDEYPLPKGYTMLVREGEEVEAGQVMAQKLAHKGGSKELVPVAEAQPVIARLAGKVAVEKDHVVVYYEETDERQYPMPAAARIRVEDRQRVKAGEQLTDGAMNPQDILRIVGREAVQRYLVDEVQRVYRSQGVSINDKHIEVIVRQMLRKVRVDNPGDTELLPGELVDRFQYEAINAKVLAEGGEPATAQAVLLGVTKASLNTYSFLAAASFQETTRVLTEAALQGSVDRLLGLKENVIIGKLIPAQSIDFTEEKIQLAQQPALLAALTGKEGESSYLDSSLMGIREEPDAAELAAGLRVLTGEAAPAQEEAPAKDSEGAGGEAEEKP